MENQWYQYQLTFEQVEDIRKRALEDKATAFDLQQATGNDLGLTDLILHGPEDYMIENLKASDPDSQIYQDFDAIWGVGAAAHYANTSNFSFLDHVSEIPGAAVRGVAGAAAEFAEFYMNNLDVAGILGRTLGTALSNKLAGNDVTLWEAYNSTKVEFDADTILRGFIKKPETITGQMTEGLVQFMAPFMTGIGAVSKIALFANAGIKGKIASGTLMGFITDYAFFDEDDPLMVTAIADYYEIESEIVDKYLRKDPDNPEVVNRFMSAIEGAAIGVPTDFIMAGLGKIYRRVSKGEISPEDAKVEAEALLDQVKAEDIDPGSLRVIAEYGDPKVSDPTIPWHLRPRTTDPIAEATRSVVPQAEQGLLDSTAAVNEVVTTAENFARTLQGLTGREAPPKPSAAEHKRAIVLAQKVWAAARNTDLEKAWDDAVEFLRTSTDNFAGAAVRTRTELSDALQRPFSQISQMMELGDAEGIRSFMTSATTLPDFRIRQAALDIASRVAREQTAKMARLYDSVIDRKDVGIYEAGMLREMFNKQVQFSMELESLYTNIGSEFGAGLGARAGHMALVDELREAVSRAKEDARKAKKSDREVKLISRRAAKDAEAKLIKRFTKDAEAKQASNLLTRYRELVNEGVDPLLAFERVREMGRQAKRDNVTLLRGKRDLELAKSKLRLESEALGDKLLRGLEQWRYDSMLSGWKTHETNFMASFAQMTSRVAYEAVFGDKATRIAAGRKVSAMVFGLKDAFSQAMVAYKEMKPVLDQLSSFERLDPVYKNHILTYPTRLMLATDQFVKQLTYKGEVYASAAADADLAKMTGTKRDEFIQGRIDASIDPETGAGLDALAINRAQEVTFQKEFNKDSKYFTERFYASANELLSKTWPGRFLFPFMRIFFRLTDEGIRMTPGLRDGIGLGAKLINGFNGKPGSSKFYDDLFGHNGKVAQARAAGEFAIGYSITGLTLALIAEGKITGGEERHYIDAMMRRQIAPPYSIRVGDKWVSYERFEPFAFPMKFFANTLLSMQKYQESADRGDFGLHEEFDLTHVIGAVSYAFGQAVVNNSFMEGIEQLAKVTSGSFDQGEAWKRPVHTMADSFVPNILRKVNQALDTSGNKYEAQPITWDAFKRHFSSVIDMSDVDIQRNRFLGEPYTYTFVDAMQGMSNFVGKPVLHDPAMELLVEANEETGAQLFLKRPTDFSVSFAGQSVPIEDLRKVTADGSKRSLYDKYLDLVSTVQIDGKTYREALTALTENEEFMRLSWGNRRSPGYKVQRLRELKNAYENEALRQLENNDRAYKRLMSEAAHELSVITKRQNDSAMPTQSAPAQTGYGVEDAFSFFQPN